VSPPIETVIPSDRSLKAQRLFVSTSTLVEPFTHPDGCRQAIDVAGLKATSIQNILTIVTVLGFLAHGYVTEEFEVTEERLGVYLPVRPLWFTLRRLFLIAYP
jgi:hypothetical protein